MWGEQIEFAVDDGSGSTITYEMLPFTGASTLVSDAGGDGFERLSSTIWTADVQTPGGAESQIVLTANLGTTAQHCAGGSFNVKNETNTVLNVRDHGSNDASVRITLGTVATQPTSSSGDMKIKLGTSGVLEVQDHNGNPIFRVDEDGDLHGLTGKALTFDL